METNTNNVEATASDNLEGKEVEKTYTQAELDKAIQSEVSRAINDFAKVQKDKYNKTTDQRVAELEAELARRDNLDTVRRSLKENGIDESLEALFVGDNYEDKINAFNAWYKDAIEKGVQDKISSSSPVHLNVTAPSTKRGLRSLAEINSSLSD